MFPDNQAPSTVAELQRRLDALESEKLAILAELTRLRQSQHVAEGRALARPPVVAAAKVAAASDNAAKITLFRSLFRGREDVFPRRWQNAKNGKSGYSPVCRHEWVRGICEKPRVKCGECPHQAFIPVADDVIKAICRARIAIRHVVNPVPSTSRASIRVSLAARARRRSRSL